MQSNSLKPVVRPSVCSSVRLFVRPAKSLLGLKGPCPPQELEGSPRRGADVSSTYMVFLGAPSIIHILRVMIYARYQDPVSDTALYLIPSRLQSILFLFFVCQLYSQRLEPKKIARRRAIVLVILSKICTDLLLPFPKIMLKFKTWLVRCRAPNLLFRVFYEICRLNDDSQPPGWCKGQHFQAYNSIMPILPQDPLKEAASVS